MTRLSKRYAHGAAAVLLAAAVAGCEKSDKIPPMGARMTVAATPSTIPLASLPECLGQLNVTSCGTSQVVATVASGMDLPLPDQDVRFSSSAGKLFTGSVTSPVDAANVPIRTDRFGNATVGLITSTTTTVTARSGSASGSLTINTVSGNLSQILLNIDTTSTGCTTSSQTVTSCSQEICVVAEAQDATGKGISGVVVLFKLQNNVLSGNTFSGVFIQSQQTTDSNGKALSKFTPDSTCPNQCSTSQNKSCKAEMIVTTQGGNFQSSPLQLFINIP